MNVIKFGLRPREDLPRTLPQELADMETTIAIDLTGNYYYDHNEYIPIEYNISWLDGQWTIKSSWFKQKRTVTISARRRNILGKHWVHLFSLDDLRMDSPFTVDNFEIDLDERKVTFFGVIPYPHDKDDNLLFKTSFTFSKTSFFMRSRSEAWNGDKYGYAYLDRRTFQQPDTEDEDFQEWDNEFHNPPFNYL